MASMLSGVAFGAAMVAAGFSHPTLVSQQLKLQDWHLVQTLLTATASSAAIYAIAERLGFVKLRPRSSSPLGLFANYDGNITGGALLGAGMALSGAGPEILLAQAAGGLKSGLYALGGAIVGGIAWTGFLSGWTKRRKEEAGVKAETVTMGDQFGLSNDAMLLVFETTCLGAVAASVMHSPEPLNVQTRWIIGGVCIGVAQLVSLVSRRSLMGISGAYEEMGSYFWWLASGLKATSKPSHQNILFAVGTVAGALATGRMFPALMSHTPTGSSPLLAALGGALMTVGSRMAGGCTSGHGLSGLALLSTSSIVTMESTFAAGLLVAPFVN
ncbi:UPF0394 membrane protein [Paramyrothecium foliicola]|nr:UPF0394 membrane protein [Paramyrothecium foliicola]